MPATTPPALEVIDLDYEYADGTPAVSGCSLTVAPGERWGLIGANGAGKTTLLLLLDGLLIPKSGQIRVAGRPLDTENDRRAARRQTGIVFQNPDDQLFSPSVFDDVVFGPLNLELPKDEAHQRAHDALARVGLPGYENRVPQHLSSGEKRGVSIATVLAMNPDTILLDEPTANLDPRARQHCGNLLRSLSATLLIATHDFEFILGVCSHVALLGQGRIVATGQPREILAQKDLLEANGLVQPTWLPHLLAE
ncbi:MAG: energy-coupling factor ABC transporter ATP-binding protein [Planctomycetota bacterium]